MYKKDSKRMPFIEHLKELRKRLIISVISLIVGMVLCYIFYQKIIIFLYKPFELLPDNSGKYVLYINSLLEGFLIRLQASFWGGIVLSIPVHLINIVGFIFPGLTDKEKKILTLIFISSFILTVLSISYGYFIIVPIVIKVLTTKSFVPDSVGILLSFKNNIFLIFQFVLASLILFQTPLIAEFLMILKIVKRKTMIKFFRYIIVVIFILSAILTPPDVMSQILVAIPLVVLFMLAILIATIFKFGED